MSDTARLGLPYILSSQSQKEVTHNSALNRIDVLLGAVVQDRDLTAPPASPAEGELWIAAAGATGDWAGHDGDLAYFVGGAWEFWSPPGGFAVRILDEGLSARWTGAAWEAGILAGTAVTIGGQQVVGAQQAAIADAAGGSTQDPEARAAINALLAACRAHGLILS